MTDAQTAAPASTPATTPATAPAAAPTGAQGTTPATTVPARGESAPAAATAPAEGTPAPKPAEPAATAPDPAKPADAVPEFKVPDEFKDKPWASKVKSLEDVFKQIDTLDALKGRKSVVPDLATSTPEEREAYYAQLRPKSADEYQFVEGIPLEPEMKTAVTDMLMKHGISATQGNEIIKAYQELGEKQMAAQFDPDGFKASMETAFGKEWEKVTGTARNAIKGLMNAEDQTMLDHLPNTYLGMIYRTLGNVVKAYGIKETDQAHLQGGGGSTPTDVTSIRSGLRDQMSAMSSRPHTAQEMMDLRQKLADTYKNDPRLAQPA